MITPAYRELGEATSGFYFLNPQNSAYGDWKNELTTHEALVARPGFAVEYATAIIAGKLGSVSTGFVYAVTNAFYGGISKGEKIEAPPAEREAVIKWIRNQAGGVSETSAGPILKSALLDGGTKEKLYPFFDREMVDEVRHVMLEGLGLL